MGTLSAAHDPHSALGFSPREGVVDRLLAIGPPRLTVLAYRRVGPTAEAFAAQMDWVERHYEPVSLAQVVSFGRGEGPLSRRALLVTFDEGYRENAEQGVRVLRERGIPALMFLTTQHVGSATPLDRDLVTYCFRRTRRTSAKLPELGERRFPDEASRRSARDAFIAALDRLREPEKDAALHELPERLDVLVPRDAFEGVHLSWDEVRALAREGVEMGAHTMSRPILTRVSRHRARDEVLGSKQRIEAEIGRPVVSFAYPRGAPGDFDLLLQELLCEVGFAASFTVVPGPSFLPELRRSPQAIRRIAVSATDPPSRFAAKVLGLPRMLGRLSRIA